MSVIHLHDIALASASRLTRVLAPLDLGHHELKGLEYILVVACTSFGPRTLELFGEGFAVFGRDLSLFGAEVGFVAYNDNRDPIDGLDIGHGQSFCVCSMVGAQRERTSGSRAIHTRWLRILSRITRAISKLCLLATE
jgi:hypothetical protein